MTGAKTPLARLPSRSASLNRVPGAEFGAADSCRPFSPLARRCASARLCRLYSFPSRVVRSSTRYAKLRRRRPCQLTEQRRSCQSARHGRHGVVALVLALFVLALYYPLLFTNRVLASGDALLYFYPYRDYVAAVLRAGQLPFWNPYLFAGAPLLANPQAAVLYPLHWPLIWLPVTAQVYWSAAIHTWLLALGGYGCCGLGAPRPGRGWSQGWSWPAAALSAGCWGISTS